MAHKSTYKSIKAVKDEMQSALALADIPDEVRCEWVNHYCTVYIGDKDVASIMIENQRRRWGDVKPEERPYPRIQVFQRLRYREGARYYKVRKDGTINFEAAAAYIKDIADRYLEKRAANRLAEEETRQYFSWLIDHLTMRGMDKEQIRIVSLPNQAALDLRRARILGNARILYANRQYDDSVAISIDDLILSKDQVIRFIDCLIALKGNDDEPSD